MKVKWVEDLQYELEFNPAEGAFLEKVKAATNKEEGQIVQDIVSVALYRFFAQMTESELRNQIAQKRQEQSKTGSSGSSERP